MGITIVAAVSKNGVIGANGGMPWPHLSHDLKRFQRLTREQNTAEHKAIVAGVNTWESFPSKPLPGRLNIVVSKNPSFSPEGAHVCTSLSAAISFAGHREVYLVGGERIFREGLAFADRILLTKIEEEYPGDAFFREALSLDSQIWWQVMSAPDPHKEGLPDTSFTWYQRVKR